ncbi:MAG: DUF2007 domain-containing protein [Chloroflexi bacterium]|nr:DUF2007 domain-containing protein [Chloroflexota bacterium]
MSALVLGLLGTLRRGIAHVATRTGGRRVPMPPVEVYRAANEMEAQVVKGRLESEGIPVMLRYEAAGPVFGLAVGALAEVRVLVPALLAEQARRILDEAEDEQP